MKCIAYRRADGGSICIVRPCPDFAAEFECEGHAFDHVMFCDVPKDAMKVVVLDESDIPEDRTFRNAFDIAPDGSIIVDMPKARDIHRDRMRAARAPKLAALDVEIIRALESGSGTSQIVVAKQSLRDVTKDPRIEAAGSPDELAAIWPDVLGA